MVSNTFYRRILIIVPTVFLPLLYGGSHEAFWAPVAGCFFLLAALFIWLDTPAIGFQPKLGGIWIVAILLAAPFVQVIPLPTTWIQVLSPTRARWLRQAAAVTGLSSAHSTLSYVPLTTFFHGLLWLFLAAFALLLRGALEDRKTRVWYLNLLLAVGTVEAGYGLLQVLVPSLGVLWDKSSAYSGFARGTFINRNHYGAFLNLLWPLLLGYVLSLKPRQPRAGRRQENVQVARAQTRQKQVLCGFLVALMLLALVFSASRGAILSSVAAATVFLILGGVRQRRAVLAVLACWLVMFAYGSILGFDEIVARFNTLDSSAAGRFEIWRETWQQVSDHPLVGTGLGSYSDVFKIYQSHLPETVYTRHAHDDYLQMAAELGLPIAGLIALVVWGFWWHSALRVFRARKTSRPDQRLIAAGVLAGTAAFLLHCWLDFNWQMAANASQLVASLVLIRVSTVAMQRVES